MRECPRCNSCYDDEVTTCVLDESPLKSAFSGSRILDHKYELLKCLGKGGMGAVYLAVHQMIGRRFAVKLIHPDRAHHQEYLERFQREAKALGQIRHPNIVEVTDYGVDARDGGIPYLVMEYLEGHSLEDQVRKQGPVPVDQALLILESIARGLDYAHQKGILHRDLKPANILIGPNPQKLEVKIADFGLVHFFLENLEQIMLPGEEQETRSLGSGIVVLQNLTSPGKVVGTPPYMAPEIIATGKVSVATDIFGFGVLAYQILTGRLPFFGTPGEIFLQMNAGPPKPSTGNPSLSPDLDQPLMDCISSSPQKRPPSGMQAVLNLKKAYLAAKVRSWKETELPRRTALAVLVAIVMLILFSYSNKIPFLVDWENKFFDMRVSFSTPQKIDPRILLLTIDEATLASDPAPLTGRADEIGRMLNQIIQSGAAGIAIDLLLPDQWSQSEEFTRLILEHPDDIAAAALSSETEITGTGFVNGPIAVTLGPKPSTALFGLVNLQEDRDGIVRRFRPSFPDSAGQPFPSFSFQAARLVEDRLDIPAQTDFWINYSVDAGMVERISWKDIATTLEQRPEAFRNRLVLLGAEYAGSGDSYTRIPHPSGSPDEISGLILQALMVNTLLGQNSVRSVGPIFHLLASVLFLVVIFPLLYLIQDRRFFLILPAALIIYVFLSFVVFRTWMLLIPVAPMIIIILLGSFVALVLRKKLTPFPE